MRFTASFEEKNILNSTFTPGAEADRKLTGSATQILTAHEHVFLYLYRFRRSEPYGAWNGIWNGTREANKSLQPNVLMPESPLKEGSENCLHLNVYTKSIDNPNAKAKAGHTWKIKIMWIKNTVPVPI